MVSKTQGELTGDRATTKYYCLGHHANVFKTVKAGNPIKQSSISGRLAGNFWVTESRNSSGLSDTMNSSTTVI